MIDYKLVKQLKEVGFLFKNSGNIIYRHCESCEISEELYEEYKGKCSGYGDNGNCGCFCHNFPTLPELIDACGDRFGELRKEGDGFMAGGGKMDGVDEITWEFEEYDKIHEVAVAKLFIKLQEKIK